MASKKSEYELEVVNRKAKFDYHFIDTFEAGVMLTGTEVKSVRRGNVNLRDAYCFFRQGELYIKSLFIAEYNFGNQFNHEARRTRKLLLKKLQLRRLEKHTKEKGFTIVPARVYINERGLVKVEIALAQGKKSYDKRQSIKERDSKRELNRLKKAF